MPQLNVNLGEKLVQTCVFDKDVISIGRSRENDVVIEALSVSRNHARIRREDDGYTLTDLQSANGTYLNGQKISTAQLRSGDKIAIGKSTLQFSERALSETQKAMDAFESPRTVIVRTAPVGELVVLQGRQHGQRFEIDRNETLIGRGDNCPVRLLDWFVSKRHAIIQRDGDSFHIRDFGKITGVQVNGSNIRESHLLRDGDEIKVGPVALRFSIRLAHDDSSQDIGIIQSAGFDPVDSEPSLPEALADVQMEMPEMPDLSEAPSEYEDASFSDLSEESSFASAAPNDTMDTDLVPGVDDFLEPEEDQLVEFEPLEPGATIENGRQPEAQEAVAGSPEVEPQSPGNPAGDNSAEIALWEKALENPSAVIRREAARKLKRFTGRDYDV